MTHLLKKKPVLAAALALLAFMAQAQIQTSAQTSAATAEKAAPRYAASDLARAFSFMDGDKDGKVSREEAAGFRNVAKHFGAADTNHDQALSLEEFSSAMNRPKNP